MVRFKTAGRILVISGVSILFAPFLAYGFGIVLGPIRLTRETFPPVYAIPFFVSGGLILFLGLVMIAAEKW